jgi:hypothetical protein
MQGYRLSPTQIDVAAPESHRERAVARLPEIRYVESCHLFSIDWRRKLRLSMILRWAFRSVADFGGVSGKTQFCYRRAD